MATWQISNLYKKEAIEKTFWMKDDLTISFEEGFRWGKWTCQSDEKPNLDLRNQHGYCLSRDSNYEWELETMDDGCWGDWEFPEAIDEEEQERIQDLWEEGFFEAMEEDGWMSDDTEYWIRGPIMLKNLDTGEEFSGEEDESAS